MGLNPNLVGAQLALKDAEQAQERLQKRDAAELAYQSGLVHYASGELEKAIGKWREAVSVEPGHRDARVALELVGWEMRKGGKK